MCEKLLLSQRYCGVNLAYEYILRGNILYENL